jgi:hypothetical protein
MGVKRLSLQAAISSETTSARSHALLSWTCATSSTWIIAAQLAWRSTLGGAAGYWDLINSI